MAAPTVSLTLPLRSWASLDALSFVPMVLSLHDDEDYTRRPRITMKRMTTARITTTVPIPMYMHAPLFFDAAVPNRVAG